MTQNEERKKVIDSILIARAWLKRMEAIGVYFNMQTGENPEVQIGGLENLLRIANGTSVSIRRRETKFGGWDVYFVEDGIDFFALAESEELVAAGYGAFMDMETE